MEFICLKNTIIDYAFGKIIFEEGKIYEMKKIGEWYLHNNCYIPEIIENFISVAEWRQNQINSILE